MNRNNQHHNPFLVGYEQIRFQRFVKVTDEDGFPLSAEIDLHSSQRHLPDNLILESRCRHNQREVFVLIDGQEVSDEFRKKYPYEGSIHDVIYEISGRKGPKRHYIGGTFNLKQASRLVKELPFHGSNYGRYWKVSYAHLTDEAIEFMEKNKISDPELEDSDFLYVTIFNAPFIDEGYCVKLDQTPWIDSILKKAVNLDLKTLRMSHGNDGMPASLVSIVHMAAKANVGMLIFDKNAELTPGLRIVKPDYAFS